jgi:hypothetical protein
VNISTFVEDAEHAPTPTTTTTLCPTPDALSRSQKEINTGISKLCLTVCNTNQ